MCKNVGIGIAVLMTVLIAGPVYSANLLANSQFSVNFDNWTPYATTPVWSSDDSNGSLNSGSVAVSVGGDIPLGVTQCVELGSETEIEFGVDRHRASGTGNAFVWIAVTWYSSPACAGGSQLSTDPVQEFITDAWGRTSGTVPPPGSAVSAEMWLTAGTSGGGAEVHFDGAYFGQPVIFEDGLEVGDISRWSASTP